MEELGEFPRPFTRLKNVSFARTRSHRLRRLSVRSHTTLRSLSHDSSFARNHDFSFARRLFVASLPTILWNISGVRVNSLSRSSGSET